MIVKNEASRLVRCLDSVREFVDEIVIADTGSSDGTLEMVNKLAHKPLQFTWNDDFSAARNHTLDHATGDWIIFIDADEYLHPESGQALRKALLRNDVLAYRIQRNNQLGQDLSASEFILRLFRNLPSHEQVTPSIALIMKNDHGWNTALLPELIIEHEGYNPDCSDQESRHNRVIHLLQLMLEETPDDPYIHYKLSENSEHLPQLREHLFRAAQLVMSLPEKEITELAFAPELLTKAAIEWANSNEADRAIHACHMALEHFSDHPSTRLALGIAYLAEGRDDRSLEEIEKSMIISAPVDGFYYDRTSHEITAYLMLSKIYSQKNAINDAIHILKKARQKYPADMNIFHALLQALLDSNQPGEVLKESRDWLKSNPTPQCLLLCADAVEMLGDKEMAEQWRSRATNRA